MVSTEIDAPRSVSVKTYGREDVAVNVTASGVTVVVEVTSGAGAKMIVVLMVPQPAGMITVEVEVLITGSGVVVTQLGAAVINTVMIIVIGAEVIVEHELGLVTLTMEVRVVEIVVKVVCAVGIVIDQGRSVAPLLSETTTDVAKLFVAFEVDLEVVTIASFVAI